MLTNQHHEMCGKQTNVMGNRRCNSIELPIMDISGAMDDRPQITIIMPKLTKNDDNTIILL